MSTNKQHTISETEKYILVSLVGALEPEAIPHFEAEWDQMVKPTHDVLIQCQHLSLMPKHWVRPLVALQKSVTSMNKKLVFIQVPEKVLSFFKDQGVDGLFICKNSLQSALKALGYAQKQTINTDFINPFLSATMHVLEVQAQTKTVPGKPFLKTETNQLLGDISGVIGLVSESFNGTVTITFPELTFLSIASKMFGETQTTLNKENQDVAGELTNIIFGQAKIELNNKGYGIKTALPSVVTGKDHSVTSVVKGLSIVVPFESDSGSFFVEITTSP